MADITTYGYRISASSRDGSQSARLAVEPDYIDAITFINLVELCKKKYEINMRERKDWTEDERMFERIFDQKWSQKVPNISDFAIKKKASKFLFGKENQSPYKCV